MAPLRPQSKTLLKRLAPVVLLNLIALGVAVPVLPALAQKMGGGGLYVGALFSVQAAGQFALASVWGALSDRFGRKPILLLTLCLIALCDLGTALSPSLPLLLLSRLAAGMVAGNVATASALISDGTLPEERSRGMALIGICFGLGFTFGPILGALAGWAAPDDLGPWGKGFPFVVAAALNLGAALWCWRGIRELRESAGARESARSSRRLGALGELFGRREVRGMGVFFLVYSIGVTIMETTFYLYMAERYGFDEKQVGLFFGGMGLLGALVQGRAGRLGDRIGLRAMTFLGTLLLGVGIGVATAWEQMGWLVVWLSISSVGRALMQPGAMAIMSHTAQDLSENGRVMAFQQSAQSLGRAIGPTLGGALFATGIIRLPFWVSGGLIAAMGVVWFAAGIGGQKE